MARPYITKKLNIRPQDSDPLFITAAGTGDKNISRHVTEFFKENNLHITTTAVRSMVEMEMKELYDKGQITSAEREAIANTSGKNNININNNNNNNIINNKNNNINNNNNNNNNNNINNTHNIQGIVYPLL